MRSAAPIPMTRDLVLVGGGHAHALALRMWGMAPLAGVRLTLINPDPTAAYSGMLPGHIAGHYSRAELDIDLVKLARFAGARLIMAPAEAIDPRARTIAVTGRGDIGYDVASIDVGIHARMPDITGFLDHGIGAKPLDGFADRWLIFLRQAAAEQGASNIVVIGGGVAGVELALSMAQALRTANIKAQITVIEAGNQFVARAKAAEHHLLRALSAQGVQQVTGATVVRVEAEQVVLDNGQIVASDFTVGAAGAFAHEWLAGSKLPTTEAGFVQVDAHLRVTGFDSLFAVGDCAHMGTTPRPKAGVFAVRSAPVLTHNLKAVLSGGKLREFRPQKDYLKLISLGVKTALAEKWGLCLSGSVMWRWKDRIDRSFMDKFAGLPIMTPAKPPRQIALGGRSDLPLCGGCGSKVAPAVLTAALQDLPRLGRDDVLSGPGDDAAILQIGAVQQVLTTDHLRGFSEDFGLMARVAAVHALGDIWAMGAAPQSALLSVTLPHMSQELQARSMAEIMQQAGAVLSASGAEIVGGHSTMGAELTIGLSLTGLLTGRALTIAGAKPGDALILTRPIGSGTILAAEMQGVALGRDVADLLRVMAQPQGDAAEILHDANAMTDVTGFGLAGHLMAICRASGVAAEIDLAAMPVYQGAEKLAQAGQRSSLYEANAAAAPVIGAEGARAALLHDPQTAGGLLAAVSAQNAGVLVATLRAHGHQAARIGRLTAGHPVITVTR